MKNNILELCSAVALIITSIILLNPWHLWMPDVLVMCLIGGLLVVFGIFAAFLLREVAVDEREEAHRSIAGRNAFLVGAAILIIAIAIQEYREQLDGWLVAALIGMVITKLVTRLWSDRNS